jgi:hypothetical protein
MTIRPDDDLRLECERYGLVPLSEQAIKQIEHRLDRLDALLSKHGLEDGLDLIWEIRHILDEG